MSRGQQRILANLADGPWMCGVFQWLGIVYWEDRPWPGLAHISSGNRPELESTWLQLSRHVLVVDRVPPFIGVSGNGASTTAERLASLRWRLSAWRIP